MEKFEFTSQAVRIETAPPGVEKVGVWTDGVGLYTEHEREWPAAMRLVPWKTYKITVEEIEA